MQFTLAAVLEMMSHRSSGGVAGIVIDILCVSMIDVAKQLKLSSYIFFPSGAAFLGLMFDLQSLKDDRGWDLAELPDSDAVISISSYRTRSRLGFCRVPCLKPTGSPSTRFSSWKRTQLARPARIPRFTLTGRSSGDGREEILRRLEHVRFRGGADCAQALLQASAAAPGPGTEYEDPGEVLPEGFLGVGRVIG